MDYIQLILVLGLLSIYLANLSHKLRILQEKDYWRGRVLADKSTFKPNMPEFLLVIITLEVFKVLGTSATSEVALTLVQIALVGFIGTWETLLLSKRLFKRPRPTLRIALISAFIGLISIILAVYIKNYVILLAGYSLAVMVIVLVGNELARHIVYIGHRKALGNAQKGLESISRLKTIGITGSYGKSTTKEFLNVILQQSNEIISTPGSINTDIGLATSINSQLGKLGEAKQKIKFAVLEMDAYVVGTIARITKYFKLDTAVITSVNEQHLDTFGGNIKNTIKGITQIIGGLKENGDKNLVLNYDNEYTKGIGEEFKKKGYKVFYYGQKSSQKILDAFYENVETIVNPGSGSIKFNLEFSKDLGENSYEIQMPVIAEFNASNYTAAALIAKLQGLTDDDIKAAAAKVTTKEKTLDIKLTGSKIEIIDDSFNANPESVRQNLKLIQTRNEKYPCPNLIIFTGLYDIGPESERIHKELGAKLSEFADSLIITNPSFGAEIIRGVDDKNMSKFSLKNDPEKVIELINEFLANRMTDKEVTARIMIINNIPASVYKFIHSIK